MVVDLDGETVLVLLPRRTTAVVTTVNVLRAGRNWKKNRLISQAAALKAFYGGKTFNFFGYV